MVGSKHLNCGVLTGLITVMDTWHSIVALLPLALNHNVRVDILSTETYLRRFKATVTSGNTR